MSGDRSRPGNDQAGTRDTEKAGHAVPQEAYGAEGEKDGRKPGIPTYPLRMMTHDASANTHSEGFVSSSHRNCRNPAKRYQGEHAAEREEPRHRQGP